MIKKVLLTILALAVTCGAVYTQDAGILRRISSTGPPPGSEIGEWSPALVEAPFTLLKKTPMSCGSAKSMVPELLTWSQHVESFRGTPVGRLPDRAAFFFVSGMAIDADGAPNAYHPDDIGLDELANAGKPGHWDGIITAGDGIPLIQQQTDPSPGYYISCTSLFDKSKKVTDPTRYVDASKIPYVALPRDLADREGLQLGDLAFVVNLHNNRSSYAIFADIGTLGEGSIALADTLGIWSNARQGGEADGILYLLFPGSGNHRPHGVTEIQHEGENVLLSSDKIKNLSWLSCTTKDNPAQRNSF